MSSADAAASPTNAAAVIADRAAGDSGATGPTSTKSPGQLAEENEQLRRALAQTMDELVAQRALVEALQAEMAGLKAGSTAASDPQGA